MNRSAWQFDLLPELGELASQLAHPMHDRLAAGAEPAAGEADRVTQLAEGSVVGGGVGRTGLPDCLERSVKASELLEWGGGPARGGAGRLPKRCARIVLANSPTCRAQGRGGHPPTPWTSVGPFRRGASWGRRTLASGSSCLPKRCARGW